MSSPKDEQENVESNSDMGSVELKPTRPLRVLANKMAITVNELVIAAGTIKVIRNKRIPVTPAERTESLSEELNEEGQEIVFDEINEAEFNMAFDDAAR